MTKWVRPARAVAAAVRLLVLPPLQLGLGRDGPLVEVRVERRVGHRAQLRVRGERLGECATGDEIAHEAEGGAGAELGDHMPAAVDGHEREVVLKREREREKESEGVGRGRADACE